MSDKHQPEAALRVLPQGPAPLRNVLAVPALRSWPLLQRGRDHFADFRHTPLLCSPTARARPAWHLPGGVYTSAWSFPRSTAVALAVLCHATSPRVLPASPAPRSSRDRSRRAAARAPLLAVGLPVQQMRFHTCCFPAALRGARCARREPPASLPGAEHRGALQQGTAPAPCAADRPCGSPHLRASLSRCHRAQAALPAAAFLRGLQDGAARPKHPGLQPRRPQAPLPR